MKTKTKIFISVSVISVIAIVTACLVFCRPVLERYDFTDCKIACRVTSGMGDSVFELSNEQRDKLINLIENAHLEKSGNKVPFAVGGSVEYKIELKIGDNLCIMPHLSCLIISDKNTEITMTEDDNSDKLIVGGAKVYKCNNEALAELNAVSMEITG